MDNNIVLREYLDTKIVNFTHMNDDCTYMKAITMCSNNRDIDMITFNNSKK
jgi:hypothetical protein